jgi:hypothetical protein
METSRGSELTGSARLYLSRLERLLLALPGTISLRCSALLLPDPIDPDPLDYDTAFIHAAVLEFGPTEILPPVGAISPHHARLC